MIQSEKATYNPDLPHRAQRDGEGDAAKCICGRPMKDRLHEPIGLPEKAIAGSRIVRELGS